MALAAPWEDGGDVEGWEGGIVLDGFGDVSAYMRAAAIGSAMLLNSAVGVMLPGSRSAPPMTSSCFARRKVCGSVAAAVAKVVSGPIAIRVIVLGGLSRRRVRISSVEGFRDGVKRDGGFECVCGVLESAVDVIVSSGADSKRCFHADSGLVW